jgi:hypothetical protein
MSKGGKKLKELLNEKQRHAALTDHKEYLLFSVSRDGTYQTYTCKECGAAVTVPTGSE